MDMKNRVLLTQEDIRGLIGDKEYNQAIEKFHECGKLEISVGTSFFEVRCIDEDMEKDKIYYSLIPLNPHKRRTFYI